MKDAVIGLGSNLGDRADNLARARALISARAGHIVRVSTVIETPSWGFTAPPFLNQVIVIRTELQPLELLDVLQAIERELGRSEKTIYENGIPQYHSRTIDLDILDYDSISYQDERLILPHPRIAQREFVLRSLDELGLQLTQTPSEL